MGALIFAAVLLSTLYFDSAWGFFGLSFYGLLGVFAVYVLLTGRIDLAKGDWVRWVMFCLLAAGAILLSAQFQAFGSASIKNFIVICASSLAALALMPLFRARPGAVAASLRIVILLHAGVFLAQLALWYGAAIDLDVGGLLGGAGHRAFYTNNIYRATGVYDEPALYGIFMLALCVCLFLYERRLSGPMLLGLLTLPLTLSMASIALFILAVTLMRARLWLWLVVCALLLLPFVVDLPVAQEAMVALGERLGELGANRDGSTQYKNLVMSDWLASPATIWLGFGLEGYSPDLYPEYYEAMYDLTLPGSNLSGFGVLFGIPALLVFYSFFLGRAGWRTFLLFAILSAKLSLYHLPFLWLVVALILSARRYGGVLEPGADRQPSHAAFPVDGRPVSL